MNIPVRQSRGSGGDWATCSYSLKCLSNPKTSRMEMTLAGSMLSMLILYPSWTTRSKIAIASAIGLALPPNCSYQPSILYWEQNMVEDFLRQRCSLKDVLLLVSTGFQQRFSGLVAKRCPAPLLFLTHLKLCFGNKSSLVQCSVHWIPGSLAAGSPDNRSYLWPPLNVLTSVKWCTNTL